MDAAEFFHASLHCAGSVAANYTETGAHNATPCTEWDASAVLNHMVYELEWVPDMLKGRTVAQVGDAYDGNRLGKNAATAWMRACKKAAAAAQSTDLDTIVHLSYGDVAARHYLQECATDMLIHAWDLAMGLGAAYEPPEAVVKASYDFMEPRAKKLAASGYFAGPVTIPKDAPLWHKLLGIVGRDPQWSA